MSKHREPATTVEPQVAPQVPAETLGPQAPQVPAPAAPPAPPAPKIPIGQAAGKQIRCTRCGKPAAVTNARGARTQQQVISSLWWMFIRCSSTCGAFLEHSTTLVDVLEDSARTPTIKMLSHVIGQDVHCPHIQEHPDGTSTVCWERARAEWTPDEAHGVRCHHEHGFVPFPGNTYVELWQD
jgi:hypothetical protein